MKLLTKAIRDTLPALGSQDGKGLNATALVKFFTPDSSWSWWASEGEPIMQDGAEVDFQFFGYVRGLEGELGYFNLSQLESVKGPMGLPIERDQWFTAMPLLNAIAAP